MKVSKKINIVDIERQLHEQTYGMCDCGFFVKEILKVLECDMPNDEYQLAYLCGRIGTLQDHLMDVLVDEGVGKVQIKNIKKFIQKIRFQARKDILMHQKQCGNWSRLFTGPRNSDTQKENIKKGKRVIQSYLDGSKQTIKDLLLVMKKSDIELLGLSNLIRGGNYFSTYTDLLGECFGEDEALLGIINSKKQKYSWGSKKQYIENIKNTVNGALGISDVRPEKNTKKRYETREKLLYLSHEEFVGMGLRRALNKDLHYGSHIDWLSEIYGTHFGIVESLKEKKNTLYFSWKTREQTIENVRNAIGLEIPKQIRGKELYGIIYSIISIDQKLFKGKYRLHGAINNNNFFSSHIDVLIDSYPELSLERRMFGSLGDMYFSRLLNGQKKLTQKEKEILEKIDNTSEAEAIVILHNYLEENHKSYQGMISSNHHDINHDALFRLIDALKIIGKSCIVPIGDLWMWSVGYSRKKARKDIEEIEYSEGYIGDNLVKEYQIEQDRAMLMDEVCAVLDVHDRKLVIKFLAGEVDISDDVLMGVVKKYSWDGIL